MGRMCTRLAVEWNLIYHVIVEKTVMSGCVSAK
jgi:hypothetical protein